jgi:DUF1009 family protein
VKYALIAGNGRFPLLALENARKLGHEVVAVAIREEAAAEVETLAARCYWISLGQLGRLIEILKGESITEVVLAGQVKHASIFSSIRPDWRLVKLLATLRQRNTEALIGGVASVLESEGIRLTDSTVLLRPLLAAVGPMTPRKPDAEEEGDLAYGRRVALALAAVDVGQSVAVSARACVAIEAMEGTDAMLRRAASLVNGQPLRLVKVACGRRHMLWDVPVVGLETIAVMQETQTTALAVDAGRTLMLDREEMLARADDARIAVTGVQPED